MVNRAPSILTDILLESRKHFREAEYSWTVPRQPRKPHWIKQNAVGSVYRLTVRLAIQPVSRARGSAAGRACGCLRFQRPSSRTASLKSLYTVLSNRRGPGADFLFFRILIFVPTTYKPSGASGRGSPHFSLRSIPRIPLAPRYGRNLRRTCECQYEKGTALRHDEEVHASLSGTPSLSASFSHGWPF
ncbi:hypothetical protein BCR34DRAFT_211221 [Clohesyomyces aquaticus]|uniref:Uncharacterized protein n=1 Tax=Clohesyomyces aquaticus TaxID=1231657 RepID=A0A1Y1ZYA0_9PLEO|nr:hypothetical protein BCR34DRAFT_211221 [Clohesyomyces aquaticus]